MDQWLTWAATALSVFITAAGFYMAWRRHRFESLRSRDVTSWADKAIAVLLTIELCAKPRETVAAPERSKRLADALFLSSALVEQGRLFFRNAPEKPRHRNLEAYSGFRPAVLDPLVVAHKIAERLLDQPDIDRAPYYRVAQEYRRRFVLLVQSEIGRRQSASWQAGKAGETSDLDSIIAALPPE